MASLVPNLLLGVLPRLGVDPGQDGGIERWLNSATLVPRAFDETKSLYDFEIGTAESIVPFLTYDFERFALAAAESFLRATQRPQGVLNQAGWRLLELYYAAFFSAHALMRSQGAGVANLSGTTTKRISDIAAVYGSLVDIRKGSWFYRIRLFDDSDSVIQFRPVTSGSGVHDAFWREFCTFMKGVASDAVGDGLPDSADFVVGVEEISNCIRVGGDGSSSWLAKIRNEINYRHTHSAWYPEPKRQTASNAIQSIKLVRSASVRLDASKKNNPLSAFAATCGFLTSLNFELGNYLAERSTRGGAFGQKWRRFADLTELKLQA